MTDQQLALQAINEAQLILEEYLRPRPQNNDRILDKLVEVLERPDLVVAVPMAGYISDGLRAAALLCREPGWKVKVVMQARGVLGRAGGATAWKPQCRNIDSSRSSRMISPFANP